MERFLRDHANLFSFGLFNYIRFGCFGIYLSTLSWFLGLSELLHDFMASDFVHKHAWNLTQLTVIVCKLAFDFHFDQVCIIRNWGILIACKHLESAFAIGENELFQLF